MIFTSSRLCVPVYLCVVYVCVYVCSCVYVCFLCSSCMCVPDEIFVRLFFGETDAWAPGSAETELRSIQMNIDPAITGLLWRALTIKRVPHKLPYVFLTKEEQVLCLFFRCVQWCVLCACVCTWMRLHDCIHVRVWLVVQRLFFLEEHVPCVYICVFVLLNRFMCAFVFVYPCVCSCERHSDTMMVSTLPTDFPRRLAGVPNYKCGGSCECR